MRVRLGLALLAVAAARLPAQRPRATVNLVIASTTDVHGRVLGWDYYSDRADSTRGLSRAATIVDSLRSARPNAVILVDAGDMLQGNPLTYLAARRDTTRLHPVIAAMNAMRYDAAAIGNHEFNYGVPALRRAVRGATFPLLAANAEWLGGARRGAPLTVPSRIITRGGVRVALVGATTPGALIWDRENLAGRVRLHDIVPAVRREVARVRRAADVVVVVMHSGLDEATSYDTTSGVGTENAAARVAREVPGVDVIVFGHTHKELPSSVVNGVLVMQPRNWAASVGVATLTLVADRGRWAVRQKRGEVVRVAGHGESRRVVAAVEEAHAATISYVNERLGHTTASWRADSARVIDTPLLDLVLDVQRRAAKADLAASAAFDLNATLDSGAITLAQVARLYPYDNTLRAVRISGQQLRAYLEFSSKYFRQLGTTDANQSLVDPNTPGFNFDVVSGADYAIDITQPVGQRIVGLSVKGRSVQPADSFTLALNNYRQSGGGDYAMLRGAPVVYESQDEIRDLLIAEVRRRGELRPSDYFVPNWRLLPDSAVGAAYRAMRALPFDRSTAPARPPTPRSRAAYLTSGRWLRVIGTNDFHGALDPGMFGRVKRGGAAWLLAEITRAREECRPPSCTSIWVDAGDQWQGTAASNAALGRPVTELFNRFGLNAAALGNHEFDWGVDSMRARLHENHFPVLAANMLDTAGRDVPWMPNDTLLSIGTLQVGVIGIISTETSRTVRRSIVRPFSFPNPAGIIDAHARALRARGADAVIVVGHVGAWCEADAAARCRGEIVDIANALTEKIDAIVAGHSHVATATVVHGVPITQAYQKGTAIGVIDVPLGEGEPRVALRDVLPDSSAPDANVLAFVDSAAAAVRRKLSTPVATIGEAMKRGEGERLGDLVADAFRVMGAGDVSVVNAGSVRTDLNVGPLREGDVFELQPFGNALVRLAVPGVTLRQYLSKVARMRAHVSGMTLTVDTTRAAPASLVDVRLPDGRPLDDHAVYHLVLTDFMAEGGDDLGLDDESVKREVLSILDRDAVAGYLRSLPQPVRAPATKRIIFSK